MKVQRVVFLVQYITPCVSHSASLKASGELNGQLVENSENKCCVRGRCLICPWRIVHQETAPRIPGATFKDRPIRIQDRTSSGPGEFLVYPNQVYRHILLSSGSSAGRHIFNGISRSVLQCCLRPTFLPVSSSTYCSFFSPPTTIACRHSPTMYVGTGFQ